MKDMSEYFKYVTNKDEKWTGIGLTEKAGKYQGVVYRYGKITVDEDKEKDFATLHFEWDMLDSNDLPKDFFGDDFFELAGDILQYIIMEQLNEDSLQYVDTDDRENNTN
jgi:hypothetical protein